MRTTILWLPLLALTLVVPSAYAVEGDLLYFGVALNQQTLPGGWTRLGAAGNWRATLAGAVLGDAIYTAETNGALFATNPTTGDWRQIGRPEFGNTRFMFASSNTLYTIENDGSLYWVNPSDGSWARIGLPGAWRDTRAGVVFERTLFTVETTGGLFATDLTSGKWRQIGRADFGGTVFLFADGARLYSIEADGSLYSIDPQNGGWQRIGPAAGWKGTLAGTTVGRRLYTAEVSGGLYETDLATGGWRQIGRLEFAATKRIFAVAGQLNTLESDGSLYRISISAPERDPYAWCTEEVQKLFQEQGADFYHDMQARTIVGRDATHARIMEGLKWLHDQATVKDLVLIYIGCHGETMPDQGWGFVTADGTMCWGHQIKAELAKLPCEVLILIETCTSGGFASPHRGDPAVPANVTAICACAANQTTNNELDLAVGEALYGRADFDRDGIVDLDELIAYIPRRYKEWWPDAAHARAIETPIIVKATNLRERLPLTKDSQNLAAISMNGSIWSALIEDHEGDQFRVHPIGWSSRPGESYFLTSSVNRDSICLPGDGPPMLVEQGGHWYPARLLSRKGERYRVHYLGWREEEDVTPNRIRYPFVGCSHASPTNIAN